MGIDGNYGFEEDTSWIYTPSEPVETKAQEKVRLTTELLSAKTQSTFAKQLVATARNFEASTEVQSLRNRVSVLKKDVAGKRALVNARGVFIIDRIKTFFKLHIAKIRLASAQKKLSPHNRQVENALTVEASATIYLSVAQEEMDAFTTKENADQKAVQAQHEKNAARTRAFNASPRGRAFRKVRNAQNAKMLAEAKSIEKNFELQQNQETVTKRLELEQLTGVQ